MEIKWNVIGSIWEAFGKCMESMGSELEGWEVYEKYGKCMGSVWEVFGRYSKYMGSIWEVYGKYGK